jgi:hypothetical protein
MHNQEPNEQQGYTDLLLSHKSIYQLLEQIAIRDQKISWIDSEKRAALRSFQEKEKTLLQTLAEQDAVLQYTQTQLRDREAQLHEILSSRTWKMALFFQRIRTFLVPPQSRRAQILQGGLNRIVSPFKSIKRD